MNPPRPQNKSAETGRTVERDVFASHPLLPPCEDDGEPVETQRGEERRGASLFVVEAPPSFPRRRLPPGPASDAGIRAAPAPGGGGGSPPGLGASLEIRARRSGAVRTRPVGAADGGTLAPAPCSRERGYPSQASAVESPGSQAVWPRTDNLFC